MSHPIKIDYEIAIDLLADLRYSLERLARKVDLGSARESAIADCVALYRAEMVLREARDVAPELVS